jgi:hypothetical protein
MMGFAVAIAVVMMVEIAMVDVRTAFGGVAGVATVAEAMVELQMIHDVKSEVEMEVVGSAGVVEVVVALADIVMVRVAMVVVVVMSAVGSADAAMGCSNLKAS